MPVILNAHQAKKWINPLTELSVKTGMLRHYDSKLMNSYPIDPEILSTEENNRQLIQPKGWKALAVDEVNSRSQINTHSHWHSMKAHSG